MPTLVVQAATANTIDPGDEGAQTASLSDVSVSDAMPVVTSTSEWTSEAFSKQVPPKDWCDAGLLVPHEALRHEMLLMEKSAGLLVAADDPAQDGWRSVNFSNWYTGIFHPLIHAHHDNEELIYFPWVATKASLPEKLTADHKTLVVLLDSIKAHCEAVATANGGPGAAEAIASIRKEVPLFVAEMIAHLKEEEEIIPPLMRAHFTQAEENAVVGQIIQKGGLTEARFFLPSIKLTMAKWASPEMRAGVDGGIPPPLVHLLNNYFVPDYQNVYGMMRDSPGLEAKPALKKVPCCMIPCCFPCLC
mmetsp:Transcript_47880/g.89237  ORF Transcript_47880/g.89237 Transcript_47880/m.89237 type:complete len:304 (-) Transcript_47880:220-1131(-)